MSFNTDLNNLALSERLKADTLTNHQQVEKLLMSKIRCVSDTRGYVHLLAIFYGYFGAAEVLLDRFIEKNRLQDFESRRKAASIKDDIDYFNGSLPKLAGPDDLPEITNNLQAFGMLYVLEGSTLGGPIITRVLQKQLHLSDTNGFSFFNGYGIETEMMWQSFKQALERIVTNEEECKVVIASANRTFFLFRNWIEKNDPLLHAEYLNIDPVLR